jgi:hypothetical protein
VETFSFKKVGFVGLSDFLIANFGTDCLEIVADGVHFTNEIRFDAKEEFR